MDKFSFVKGGVSRLQTPFLVKDSRKGVFVLNNYPVLFCREYACLFDYMPGSVDARNSTEWE